MAWDFFAEFGSSFLESMRGGRLEGPSLEGAKGKRSSMFAGC